MSLAALLAIAVVLLILGIILWRASRRGVTTHAMRLASMILIGVGLVGTVGVVVDLVMFAVNP